MYHRRGKSAAAVAQGRAAQGAGSAFEEWLEIQHVGAKDLDVLLHVAHNQPGMRRIRGRLVYSERSGTDYTGLLKDGRTLAVEAKSTKSDRLMRSAVKSKQAEQLDAVAKAGHAAFLLVEFRLGEVVGAEQYARYAIPWAEVPWKTRRSAESISVEDMEKRWYVVPGECYLKRGVPMPVTSASRRTYARE